MFKRFWIQLVTIITLANCQQTTYLLSQYPFRVYPLLRSRMYTACSGYGVWSRYVPLSNIVKIGQIGILDSNCFHQHHAQEPTTQRINLIYYECLNYEANSIIKYLQFIDNNGDDHIYEMPIEGEYEYVWFFVGFQIYPYQKQLNIYFYEKGKSIKIHQMQVQSPFYDEELNLIFGGDLIVNENQQLHNSQNVKLSYFPGQVLIVQEYELYQDEYCDFIISYIQDNEVDECRCQQSQNTNINNQVISQQEEFLFISQQTNCLEFLFSGWIKFEHIQIFDEVVYFKFLKLSENVMVSSIINDNISPFTLTYKLSSTGNSIIITTYSYTFPSINIDFSNDPFLIRQSFDILSDLKLWHYLNVRKFENSIQISINFFQQEKYEFYQEVKQFNLVQYKLQYGDLLQTHSYYLKVQIFDFKFFNCPEKIELENECHETCKECDGPTKSDCLSCVESSNRRYYPEFKECLCEYGTIDIGDQCSTYEDLNLTLVIPEEVPILNCKYGQFEYDNECYRCPSTISENVVTCLECLQNPKEWINMLYCKTSLYSDQEGNISRQFQDSDSCYHFDGNSLSYYKCGDDQSSSTFANQISLGLGSSSYCLDPYFLNFEKKCTLCMIKFCQYCFNYFGGDHSITTLNQRFSYSIVGEEIKTGCAQCNDGFIYNFEKEECIYQIPTISNCLRSYISFDGQEICTLSSIDDFSIAPEIINCQKHIFKCKQCIKTPELIIKCIICEDGYSASAFSGICTQCTSRDNSKRCVEWNTRNEEPWKWMIQSFRIQFLQIKNFSYELISTVPLDYVIQCLDGYNIILNDCFEYCEDSCLICNQNIGYEKYFSCQKCGLNYYKKRYRGQIKGKCINCPSLCQTCEQRSSEEIQKINPIFNITTENEIYTYKCQQKVPLESVVIDPNLQIAQYCFNGNCDFNFEYQITFYCDTFNMLDLEIYYGYLENIFNYKYFNEIGLKKMTLILLFNEICGVWEHQDYIFLNHFREKVFSIQVMKLRIEGELTKPFLMVLQLQIFYFDQVTITQVLFLIRSKLELIFHNRGQPIDFNIIDTNFYSDNTNPKKLSFSSDNFLKFNLKNVNIFDLIISNSLIFSIISFDEGEIITIKNLQLTNCIFNNSTLLYFQNIRRIIIIDYLIITNCQFYSSSILTITLNSNEFADIFINNVEIKDSLFQDSNFLNSNGNSTISINKFTLTKSSVNGCRMMSFSESFYIDDVLLKENILKDSQFLISLATTFMDSEIRISNFIILENQVSNFSAFVTEVKYQNNDVDIKLENFQFESNIQDPEDNSQYLFKFTCYTLQINNIQLKSTYNVRFFSIFATPLIRVENMLYENQYQQEQVAIKFGCLQNNQINSQLLLVSGFSNLILEQIQIVNQFSIDQSIISIQSNPLINFKATQSVVINHVTFQGNILIKQKQGLFFSLIQIYSEKTQILTMDNVNFKENMFHQYQTDPSENYASLILINSVQGKIMMTNMICSSNALTNSSNSFISIFSNTITIENFQTFNHNYLDAEIWNKYYQVQISSQYTQNQITQIINNAFGIGTIGGALSITSSQMNFANGLFSNIIAASSVIFNINLQGNGIVFIKNCDIQNAYTQSISKSQVDGAITINAKKSLLAMEIENLTLKDVQNKLSSSIFSIYPSSTKNQILLNKIYAQNCFSLVNQLLLLEFDFKNADQNQVSIQNLHISQTDNALLQYLQSIGTLNPIEIQKIISDNAIINIIGCKLEMREFEIEGIILSGIIKIVDYNQIFFVNSKFYNISTFYPLNLLDFSQNNLLGADLLLNNISILNLNSFSTKKTQLNYLNSNIQLSINQCTFISNDVTQSNSEQVSINRFFEQILANSNQKGSLVHLKSITNQTQFFLRKISVLNNDCQYCWNGLIYFELTEVKVIKLKEIHCIMNFIKSHGCILAISDSSLEKQILIGQSIFMSNHGTKGTGVQVQNLRVALQSTRIINNVADEKGGGIYFNQNSQRFLLNQTLICQNQAQEGGGAYLEGNNSLNVENFKLSMILLNSADVSSSNINELPSHLALQINYQEMHSQRQSINNESVYILQLNPYKVISQDHVKRTNYLTIPSGQTLTNYQLYNRKIQQYLAYFNEISVIFKNSLNEQQTLNLINSSCNLIQQSFDINTYSLQETNNIQEIAYDSNIHKFNLGLSKFNFDPYTQNNKIYEILIQCKTEYQQDVLSYKMRVKSFFCQLGEFYVSGGCQTCQSEQGFYSVTYNTTKCSIFDKTKFDAITSNKIQLKPGYWRPNFISDYTELCYKSTSKCLGGWAIGDNTCNKGHLGGLCEECDKFNLRGEGQFFKNQQQLECQQCQELLKRLIAFLLISFWAILSTLLTIKSIEKSNQLFTSLKLKQKFADILFNLNQDHESILLKLFLNYIWIFSLIFTFNIRFSFSLGFLKQSSDTSYFMANYFECFLSEIHGTDLIYSRIILTIVLIISQILIIYLGFQILSLLTDYKYQSRILSITILYLYIQNYASVINQFFSILAARRISQIDYIQGDVSLLYGTDTHIKWIFGFIVPGSVLLVIILPFSMYTYLYFKKDKLNKIKYRRHIGYLFNEYTGKTYFWEWIKLWKKTIIIIILIYFETDIFLKATLLGLCLLIYQFISQRFKPYHLQRFNILDIQAGQLCSSAIFLAAVKYICDQQDNSIVSGVIQTMIILISLVLSFPFVIDILKVYYKKFKPQVLSSLLSVFLASQPNSKYTKYLSKNLELLKQKEESVKNNFYKLRQAFFKKKYNQNQQLNIKLTNYLSKDQLVQFSVQTISEKQV
ncbi:unnamed protein product [Paramecium octaurelia]|uniref:Transmembrane protein n=1 Tax=Paramecium octaurelia TaxID=43137 RepID=A0A8S1UWT1_PAROT|nr:unnamed protein product [Paramecium octaurelia]